MEKEKSENKFIKKRGFYAALVLMVIIGLTIFYIIQIGYYPVAVVNSNFVSAKSFSNAASSAHHYYTKAIQSIEDESEEVKFKVNNEIRRATLDKMIENVLIKKELSKRLGSDLAQLVARKTDIPQLKEPNFDDAVFNLYGLSILEFKKLVLVPQAREELLFDSIREDKDDFSKWIKEARENASVIILAPEFSWDGEKIIFK